MTSLVAILGIAIGVSALIVALALANGFRDEMREKILRGTAHINVMRADGRPISDYRRPFGTDQNNSRRCQRLRHKLRRRHAARVQEEPLTPCFAVWIDRLGAGT